LALFVLSAGCEAVTGISDFTTQSPAKSSDGGDGGDGGDAEAGLNEGGDNDAGSD